LKEIWLSAISSKKAFIVGAVLASVQQLTGLFCCILFCKFTLHLLFINYKNVIGINAVMNFTPNIMEGIGITELKWKLFG
jgi:hypothetical protein